MWNPVVSIAAAAWLAASHVGVVFAETPVAQLAQRPFNELFQDEAPVSGRVVAGVLVTGSTSVNALNLMPPPSYAGGSVCIQVMSRDGRYWSENTFTLPERIDATRVALEYPSRHEAFLHGLDFGELAILGTAGECGSGGVDTLLLSGVQPSEERAPSISIFINSGRADTYISVSNVDEHRRPSRCRKIEQGRRTGFDTVCRIDLVELTPLHQSLDVRVLRRRYERMLPPTEFTLLLPSLN
ncbi:hypothetical protein [Thiohalobacter thiocyanaticus]|uniref:Uncharacterized protein n=1 Tax=Thiohalobacter thiocyanaticus TaxID=585455 RepID=A0A426QKT0_9GAMM|nr:hypothetical protein [Thiohalobacter thiocyanaticus]RRQ22350.1 hypothetical protein D6C00_10580 [Thiohalobacter thiocyanaticus]